MRGTFQRVAAVTAVRFPNMWITVLVMALAVIFEPIRLGLAVLMLNRRRPMLQLFTFLCGGFTMGIGVGLVILFILRTTPLAGNFTVAQAQIVAGLLALLVAVVLATHVFARKLIRRVPANAAVGADGGVDLLEPTPPASLKRLSARAREFLQGDSLHVAWVSGLAVALPSANYLGAMAAILASGAGPAEQAQALLLFNVVAFTLVEIPLVSYLAAPQKTRAFMAALQEWLRTRSHWEFAVLLAAGGCFLIALGVSSL
jgi:Sap, sulfolipid-1-addressing protein